MNNGMQEIISREDPWYKIDNPEEIYSPALLIYPDRVEMNIRKMIELAGDSASLRPHVKTHKMAPVVKLQMSLGINKFKSSTIAETEMVASCGAKDILLAFQPVGPSLDRFFRLKKEFTRSKISCIADCEDVIRQLSAYAVRYHSETSIWLDINNGMDRTGIYPDEKAADLYRMISEMPMLKAEGLHVYDGHIHESDPAARKKICDEAWVPVEQLILELKRSSASPVKIIAGGTPTFPIHAKRAGVETSPGTTLLWDYGYGSSFRDLDFLFSAVLFTRIISKPSGDLICIDLGHKAVASEMPQPRIKIMEFDNYQIAGHNEEHMVIRSKQANTLKTGEVLYGIPWHICPTVDRYARVSIVRNGRVTEEWDVDAHNRKLTY
jgi:D-serine deaminase-like pyridoxal phosphate-dependent protein